MVNGDECPAPAAAGTGERERKNQVCKGQRGIPAWLAVLPYRAVMGSVKAGLLLPTVLPEPFWVGDGSPVRLVELL